jgi:hypothetical protein
MSLNFNFKRNSQSKLISGSATGDTLLAEQLFYTTVLATASYRYEIDYYSAASIHVLTIK